MSAWELSVLGVRGSCPAAAADYLAFGGNTVCMALDWGAGALLALDAGSGLAGLGAWGQAGGRRLDILLSHLHLDHLLGLFGCPLLSEPEAELHFYARPGGRQAVERLLAPPYWPLGLAESPARLCWHEVAAGESFGLAGLEGLQISAMAGRHPGGSLIYRVAGAGRSLVYALDNEFAPEQAAELAGFARDCDLLIWDAGFLPGRLKAGWGHSTWEQGCEVARAAGAGALLCTHFGRGDNDETLSAQERLAQRAFPECRFAREGLRLQI